MRVTEDNATPGSSIHLRVACASDLALRAGHWPKQLETSLGNGQPFVAGDTQYDAEGGLMYVTYKQSLGTLVLRVYND